MSDRAHIGRPVPRGRIPAAQPIDEEELRNDTVRCAQAGYTATVLVSCFAVLLAQVAYSLPGALNGTFQQEFQTTGAELTWITAAFAIPMVVFELTTGVIGDLFGRKRLLQAGALPSPTPFARPTPSRRRWRSTRPSASR